MRCAVLRYSGHWPIFSAIVCGSPEPRLSALRAIADRAASWSGAPCSLQGLLHYDVMDSCIAFVFQLDLAHVVTVEGLAENGRLTPVQQAMIRCHGSQCGFCTPGFVVAMTGLLESHERLDVNCLRDGLTGNLCRCTGYTPIITAGCELDHTAHQRIDDRFPPALMQADFDRHGLTEVRVHDGQSGRVMFAPRALDRATAIKQQQPEARLVAGATDVGVQVNKGASLARTILDLHRITELRTIQITDDEVIAGALTTWTDLEAACRQQLPEFYRIVRLFGSPQIRNLGTLGGNIANGSPIADSLPFLYVMESELDLVSSTASRTVNINDFYIGYKQCDLRPTELISRVRIPRPDDRDRLRLFKVSRRRDLDISTLTAALRLRLEGDRIRRAAIALGGVGPNIIRARRTEAFLVNQDWTLETARAAGDVAVSEIRAISDVRGTADYRRQLTRNIFLKLYYEHQAEHGRVEVAPRG